MSRAKKLKDFGFVLIPVGLIWIMLSSLFLVTGEHTIFPIVGAVVVALGFILYRKGEKAT